MRSRRYGERDVLVDVAGVLAAHALASRTVDLPGVVDVVPAARTLLVRCADEATASALAARLADEEEPAAGPPAPGREVVVEVVYDGKDLAVVAATAGLTTAEVVARHTGATYRADFTGRI